MLTRPIALAILLSAWALPACKKKPDKQAEPAPRASAPTPDAATRPRIPPATEPDLDYEARRDELLRRGDPEMMKPAPVIDGKAPEVSPGELIKPISKDVMMVGTIKVDLARGVAEIPAKVVLETGMLEYVAVGPAGKTYESLLSIGVTAVELRLALTLLGYDGTVPDAQGVVPAPTDADTVLVRVRAAGKDGKPGKDVPLSSWLVERKSGKHPPDAGWQVIGFDDAGRAAALSTTSFLTLVPRDATAPLRITGDAGNPYAGPDQGLGTDPAVVPPVGSEVTLVIARRPDAPALPVRSPGHSGGERTP